MLLLSACSVALTTDDVQCSVDTDCAERGFANSLCQENICVLGQVLPDNWKCLGTIEEPVAKPGEMHTYEVKMQNFDGSDLEGAEMRVCDPVLDCSNTPLSGPHLPDGTGVVSVQVDSGFQGYFRFTSTKTLPTLVFLTLPMVADRIEVEPITLVGQALLDFVAGGAGVVVDMTRGHALVQANDCNGEAAAGVSLSIDNMDENIARFYSVGGGQPSLEALSTDPSGQGGFLNVPEGFAEVSSSLFEGGNRIGQTNFRIFPATISVLISQPTPEPQMME